MLFADKDLLLLREQGLGSGREGRCRGEELGRQTKVRTEVLLLVMICQGRAGGALLSLDLLLPLPAQACVPQGWGWDRFLEILTADASD